MHYTRTSREEFLHKITNVRFRFNERDFSLPRGIDKNCKQPASDATLTIAVLLLITR